MNFVHVHVEESREHRGITPRPDRAAFVISEAKVCGEMALADDGFDSPIEDFHKAFRVFLVRVATHGWLIDGYFPAASRNEGFQFAPHQGQQAFRERISIAILFIWKQSAA